MNQAANTDPTKNKVFDVTLLLEKITEQFDAFKASVKTIIYDHLNYTITIGTFTYTECKIAKWVWRIVDNWGFGAVDRIIDFFKSPDMQKRLANVLLGNTELQQQLNYNGASGSLNYFAVAHVGILVFADWIFNTYIKSVPALYKTWQWIMGVVPGFSSSDTLVDVVNAIWNAGSAAITAIKNAANNFVQGIKAAGQFIANSVISLIIDGLVTGSNTLLKGIFSIFTSMFPNFGVNFSGNLPKLTKDSNAFELGLSRDGLGIDFHTMDKVFQVGNLLNINPTFDTLSVADTNFKSAISQLFLTEFIQFLTSIPTRLLISNDSPTLIALGNLLNIASLIAAFVFESHIVNSFINNPNNNPNNDNTFYKKLSEVMIMLHLGATIGTLTWLVGQSSKAAGIITSVIPMLILTSIGFTTTIFQNNPYLIPAFLIGFLIGIFESFILGSKLDNPELIISLDNTMKGIIGQNYDTMKLITRFGHDFTLSEINDLTNKGTSNFEVAINEIKNEDAGKILNGYLLVLELFTYHFTSLFSYGVLRLSYA